MLAKKYFFNLSIYAYTKGATDGVMERVLRGCVAQLAEIFTNIFHISLAASEVPSCLKYASISPSARKQSEVKYEWLQSINSTEALWKIAAEAHKNPHWSPTFVSSNSHT